MIQRIQTVFLIIVLLVLVLITFGTSIFTYETTEFLFKLSTYGVQKYDLEGTLIESKSLPFYFITMTLVLLCLFSIAAFKNLKVQLTLTNLLSLVYFVMIIAVCFSYFLGNHFTNSETVSTSLGVGFYALMVGLPFLRLAARGIKKDRELIDSVNRLR